MAGRSMLENIVRTLAPLHRSLRYEASDVAVLLFDIKAATSLGWGWIWEVTAEMRVPAWLIAALRALYEGSTARIVFGGVVTEAVFEIARGIKRGCPSSGSVWALVFDPAVRLLRAQLRGPTDELSVFADDIAATLARLLAGLPLLFRVFGLLDVAAGLSVFFSKTVVVNYSGRSDFLVKRRLLEATGIAQIEVARMGTYLEVGIGPDAASEFLNSAVAKSTHRCALVRSSPAPLRQRVVAYRVHAASVLLYLAQMAEHPKIVDVTEASALALSSRPRQCTLSRPPPQPGCVGLGLRCALSRSVPSPGLWHFERH